MNTPLAPEQRLAMSRAILAQAMRDPVWLILVQRWLQSKAKVPSAPENKPAASL